jgi:hypothetical protein
MLGHILDPLVALATIGGVFRRAHAEFSVVAITPTDMREPEKVGGRPEHAMLACHAASPLDGASRK